MLLKFFMLAVLPLSCISSSVPMEHTCSCQFNVNDIALGKISELEEKFTALQTNMAARLMEVVQEIQGVVQRQNEETENIREAIAKMTSASQHVMTSQVSQMTQRLSVVMAHLQDGFKQQMESLEAFKSEQEKKMEDFMKEIQEKAKTDEAEEPREHKDHAVAFFVTHHAYYVYNPPIFTKEVTNIGGGYNMSTGRFTCPVEGIYLFTFSVQQYTGATNAYCHIVLNGDVVTYAQTTTEYTDMGSVSAILKLSEDDDVTLMKCDGWDAAISSEATSFAGVLIQETHEENKE